MNPADDFMKKASMVHIIINSNLTVVTACGKLGHY